MIKNEKSLIEERTRLRIKKELLINMAQDGKSSVQFTEACLIRVEEINKKLDELKTKILKERKNYGTNCKNQEDYQNL